MARVDRLDIDRTFESVCVLALRVQPESTAAGWRLVEADGTEGTRKPWAIHNALGRRLVVLGYTRRDVLRSLQAQADLLSQLVG